MKKNKKTARAKKRLVIRPLELAEVDAAIDLQLRNYPHIDAWTHAQLSEHIATFPSGQLAVVIDDVIVATSTSLIIDALEVTETHVFEDICPDGSLRLHDPEGDTLYGLDIVVDQEHRGKKMARRLYDARKQLARSLNLRSMTFGGRIPGYREHAHELTPMEYIGRVLSKDLRDPVVTAQSANGFIIESVLIDYLPEDLDSCGHALLMTWRNPDYRPPGKPRHSKARVASVQYQMRRVANFEEFATQIEFFVDTASEYRCDFVIFPELLTNQLLGLVPDERPALSARRLDEFTPHYEKLFADLSLRFAINIIAGTHLVVEDDVLHNVAYLFHRDGRVDRQYKIHITPSEERWWGVNHGHAIQAFETDRGKIGIAICYDVEFPEYTRILREQGAQILFVPYNTDLRSGHVRVRSCAQARCIENNIYVVTAGACGNLPMVEGADIHYAHSAILTPSDIQFARDGIAAEATPNVEMMLIHDLDLGLLRRTERTGTVRPWIDRRTDVYRVDYTGD